MAISVTFIYLDDSIISMLPGVAVNDTIHFLNHSQLESERTCSYLETTRRIFTTVDTVGAFVTSMVQYVPGVHGAGLTFVSLCRR